MKISGLVVCLAVAVILVFGPLASAKAPTLSDSGNVATIGSVAIGRVPNIVAVLGQNSVSTAITTTTAKMVVTAKTLVTSTNTDATIGGAVASMRSNSSKRIIPMGEDTSEFDR